MPECAERVSLEEARAHVTQFVFDELRQIGLRYSAMVMDSLASEQGETPEARMCQQLWKNHARLWRKKSEEFSLEITPIEEAHTTCKN
ncbi:MAG: hypothetical protein JSS66_05610 [Armatimonadetes bacterium]|nr:hypothetical protein [Armatimonadota bacterium]